MKKRKVAFSCFIGGILCALVALRFTPNYWYVGILAGLAGGYLSYEFKKVWRAIPIVWQATHQGSINTGRNVIVSIEKWFQKPHPFLYLALIISFPVCILVVKIMLIDMNLLAVLVSAMNETLFGEKFLLSSTLVILVILYACIPILLIQGILIRFFTFIGSRIGERCYYLPSSLSDRGKKELIQELSEKGYCEKPITYTNIFRWAMKGVGLTILFFVWTLWKYMFIGIWKMIYYSGMFLWYLFKLIHSQERVLCAIDGTLGGVISYIYLISPFMSFTEKIVLVVFGGLLGAVIGILDYQIISKRILGVIPVK